jgi:hypothetical protein
VVYWKRKGKCKYLLVIINEIKSKEQEKVYEIFKTLLWCVEGRSGLDIGGMENGYL